MNVRWIAVLLTISSVSSFAWLYADDTAINSADPQRELAGWLDRRFEERWKANQTEPPAIVDDATFLRRIFLDLGGTIPSVPQTRDFLANGTPDKREKIVDQMLADPRTPKNLARVWRRMMVPGNGPDTAIATQQLEPWLAEQFGANVHYNDFAKNVLVAGPEPGMMRTMGAINQPTPPASAAAYLMAVGSTPDAMAGASTKFFLGVSLNCAKCHDHPFAKWKQRDFWGMAAFFGNPTDEGDLSFLLRGREFGAVFLGGEKATIPASKKGTEVLAEWMTSPKNTNFGATAVNRIWQHLYGRGAVSEIDDLDRVSAEERSFVLDELAKRFAATDYDVRWLMASLCKSRTYQRETPARSDAGSADTLTQRPLKSLLPEQVFDSLEQALNLPIGKSDDSPRTNGVRTQMVSRLNESATNHPDQFRSGIPQALMLMHGSMISNATDIETSRTLRAVIEAPFLEPQQKIETLYLATLTRKPREQELTTMLAFVHEQNEPQQKRQAYSEIFWALLNSPEFVLCP